MKDERRCPTDDCAESFYLHQRALIDRVVSSGPVPHPARDHLKTLALTFAGYDAARAGQAIAVQEPRP